MNDENAEAITALAMTECILAELTARLGVDFGSAVEKRMVALVKARENSGDPDAQSDVDALSAGMEMIGWKDIIGRHPFAEISD